MPNFSSQDLLTYAQNRQRPDALATLLASAQATVAPAASAAAPVTKVTKVKKAGVAGVGVVGPAWGGSQSVMDQLVTPFMRKNGLSVGSAKRTPGQNSAVGGAPGSDHLTTSTSSYAVDFATGNGAAAATGLARAMGQKSWRPGTYNRFNITAAGKRFSVQILWAVPGHFDHVHVGIRRA